MARPRKFFQTEFLWDKIRGVAGLSDDEKDFILDTLSRVKRHDNFCPQGHKRNVKNTSWYRGGPHCKICQAIKYQQKKRRQLMQCSGAERINA